MTTIRGLEGGLRISMHAMISLFPATNEERPYEQLLAAAAGVTIRSFL